MPAVELGYSETASVASTSSSSGLDVTGLAVTVQIVRVRPILITFEGSSIRQSNAPSALIVFAIKEGSTVLADSVLTSGGVNTELGARRTVRIAAPSLGAHTYKVNIGPSVLGGTVRLFSASTSKSFIRVVEA